MANNRRFLAFVIALAMVLTMIPGAVFAEDDVWVQDVEIIKVDHVNDTTGSAINSDIHYGEILYAYLTTTTQSGFGAPTYKWYSIDSNDTAIRITGVTGPYITIGDVDPDQLLGCRIKCEVSQESRGTSIAYTTTKKVVRVLSDEEFQAVFDEQAVYTYDGQEHPYVNDCFEIENLYDGTSFLLMEDYDYTVAYNTDDGSVPKDAGNYTVTVTGINGFAGNVTSAAFTISPREVSVSAITVNDKTFDGTTSASINDVTFNNVVSGEALNLTGVAVSFADADVGTGKAIDINDQGEWGIVGVTGTKASNYEFVTTAAFDVTAEIAKADLSTDGALGTIQFEVAGYTGTYDGQPHSITVTGPAIGGTVTTYSEDGTQYSNENPTYSAVGTYTVYYKIAGANYNDFTGSAIVDINNNTLTITANDWVITYGEEPANDGVTISGLKGADTTASAISGTLTYVYSYKQHDGVGVYKITPAGLTATNYAINFVAGTLTVTPKALGVGWGDTSLVYTGNAQAPGAVPEGVVSNDAISFVIDGAKTDVGENYVATISALTGAAMANYAMPAENLTTTFAITQAQSEYLTTPQAISGLVYNGTSQAIVTTGSATFGEIEYSLDNVNWSTEPAIGVNATTYAVSYRVKDNDNYKGISSASIEVNIGRKQATVAAINKSKPYGTTEPALTATVSGLVNDDTVTYSAVREPGENVGDFVITVSGDAEQGNYNVAYVPGTFTIDPLDSEITSAPAANNREYDGTSKPLVTTGSATGGKIFYRVSGEAIYSESVPVRKDAGRYLVYYYVSPDEAYAPTSPKTVWVTIDKKAATISAIDQTVTYGAAAAELTVTASGLVGNDTVEDAAVYTISREVGDNVGTYTITVTEAAVSTNYAITYVNGTYTITTGQAVISTEPAVIKNLVYDGTAQELIITGAATLGDIEYSLDGTTFSAVVPKATNAGTYTVYYQVPDHQNYYGVAVTSLAATIAPKPVTVTAITTSKAFGTSDPALTVSAEGLISGSSITSCNVTREEGEDVATYASIASGAVIEDQKPVDVTSNYAITYVNGVFTINKVAAEIITDPTSKGALIYNRDAQDLVNPGTATGGTIQYSFDSETFSEATPTGINADTYTVYYKVVGDNNHSDSDVVSLTAIIAPKAATISAVNKTKEYGQADPEFTATAAGLAGADTIELFDLIFARTAGENVSTYAITVNISGAALNYDLTFEPGELEITKATLANADLTATPIAIALKGDAPDTGARSVDLTDIYNTVIAAGNEYQGTMAYTSNSGLLMISGTPVVDDKTLNITIGAIEPDKSGTILLTVTPNDSANYKTYTIEFALTTVGKTAKTEFDDNGVATSIAGIDCNNLQDAADNISGASVQVSMSISLVSEGGVSADLKDKVSQAAINNYGTNDEAKIGREYIDVSIGAVVDGNPINITDAGVVLEIVVDYNLAGKYSPVVGHRNPDGSAELFTELATKPAVGTYQDKTFYVDSTNNKIYIYSRYYSPFVILYAKAATHTITFNANGGTPATKTQTVVDNTATNLAANTFTRASYSFKGWNTAANGTGTAYADKASVTLTTAMALYAQWTYNGGGGGSGSGGGGGGAATVKPTTTAAVTTSAVTYKNCTKDGKCAMAKFPDLVTNAWYHDGVHFVLDKGIMHGESKGKFEPDNETSRSMIAQILWNMEGNPVVNYAITYSDMTQYHWYTDAVRWTSAMNIMKGDSEGTFRGEDSLTREELAAVLYRFAQLKGQGFTGMWSFPLDYPDASKVDDWAYEAMCWMTMNGIIKGDEKGDLAPQATATRAEMATMIMRLYEYLGL